MNLPPTIAIDGPAASGKTTLGQLLAHRLHYLLLDTGSMYRAVAFAVQQKGIDVHNETAVTRLAQQINIEIMPGNLLNDGRPYAVLLDGQDITWDLRTPSVEGKVSIVAAYPGVRQELVRQQRRIAQQGQVVMVGRDIGTVVLSDSPLKIYVVASPEERARRRWQEQQERGEQSDYETILARVLQRDQTDSNRRHSPLRPATDAIVIDTTQHAPDEVVEQIMRLQPQAILPS